MVIEFTTAVFLDNHRQWIFDPFVRGKALLALEAFRGDA